MLVSKQCIISLQSERKSQQAIENVTDIADIINENEIKPEPSTESVEIITPKVKEEITDDSAPEVSVRTEYDYEELLSNVFKVSKYINTTPDSPKMEVKEECVEEDEEEIFEDDIIQLRPPIRINPVLTDEYVEEPHILKSEDIVCEETTIMGNSNIICKLQDNSFEDITEDTFQDITEFDETSPISENLHQNYKCTKCNESFKTLPKYILHFGVHKCNYTELSCPQCSVGNMDMIHLHHHVSTHIKQSFVPIVVIAETSNLKRTFQCKQCKELVAKKDFFSHWEMHLELTPKVHIKSAVMEYTEEIIEDSTERMTPEVIKEVLNLLLTPVYRKGANSKQCIVCMKHFDRPNCAKNHMISGHLLVDANADSVKNKGLKCQVCGEIFPSGDKYKAHLRGHSSLPVYMCARCDKYFSYSSNFAKHKKIHSMKMFTCDICKNKFKKKISLIKHIEMHQRTAPLKCIVCDKMLYTESLFKRHYRDKHHLNFTPGFKCMICQRRYPSWKMKWDHMWEVHKKSLYNCELCGQPYRKKPDLKKHMNEVHMWKKF